MYCSVPGFPGNACGTDYSWEVQKCGVVAEAAGEYFNMVVVLSHQGAINCEGSYFVDDASVSNVDE
jgi:hypothetical protein